MADFNKFEQFAEDLGKGIHQLHAAGHTLKVYLTNTAPDAATHEVKADLAGITEQNGYAPADVQNDYTRTGGTGSLTGVDVEWTATDGAFGPFQYVVLYNDSPAAPADPLIGWWACAAPVTVNAGEKFKSDFGTSLFTVA